MFIKLADTDTSVSRPAMYEMYSLSLPSDVSFIDEIGTNYEQFGTLILKDVSGKKMEIIKHDEQQAKDIVIRILHEWLAGKGLHPTWGNLLKVLNMMKEYELSNNVACSVNHMLLTQQHDEQ